MSELYSLASAITAQLERRHGSDALGLVRAKGALATKTGFLVSLIGPNDPDDPAKVTRLREAARELGLSA